MDERDLHFMDLAIEQAKQCRGTTRDPLVGAVLVKDDTEVAAFRGEIDLGEHAEFTLLFKKLRSKAAIEGGTLYTTLEPCTTRSHEKKPCADWIVSYGIRRVVIGMLDPKSHDLWAGLLETSGRWHRGGRGASGADEADRSTER